MFTFDMSCYLSILCCWPPPPSDKPGHWQGEPGLLRAPQRQHYRLPADRPRVLARAAVPQEVPQLGHRQDEYYHVLYFVISNDSIVGKENYLFSSNALIHDAVRVFAKALNDLDSLHDMELQSLRWGDVTTIYECKLMQTRLWSFVYMKNYQTQSQPFISSLKRRRFCNIKLQTQ